MPIHNTESTGTADVPVPVDDLSSAVAGLFITASAERVCRLLPEDTQVQLHASRSDLDRLFLRRTGDTSIILECWLDERPPFASRSDIVLSTIIPPSTGGRYGETFPDTIHAGPPESVSHGHPQPGSIPSGPIQYRLTVYQGEQKESTMLLRGRLSVPRKPTSPPKQSELEELADAEASVISRAVARWLVES